MIGSSAGRAHTLRSCRRTQVTFDRDSIGGAANMEQTADGLLRRLSSAFLKLKALVDAVLQKPDDGSRMPRAVWKALLGCDSYKTQRCPSSHAIYGVICASLPSLRGGTICPRLICGCCQWAHHRGTQERLGHFHSSVWPRPGSTAWKLANISAVPFPDCRALHAADDDRCEDYSGLAQRY